MTKNWEQRLNWCSNKALEERKTWYSSVADAYNRTRPRYPQTTIDRVLEFAQLPADAAILEIGCGPGIATVSFAQLGYSMLCLEPSLDACQLARENCVTYPKVEIQNSTFEEWQLEPDRFDAVLAATSIHWIPREVAYPKAADALKENGILILLWNAGVFPQDEVASALKAVYQNHAPELMKQYEDLEEQSETLNKFGQLAIESHRFKDLIYEQQICKMTYNTDDYLTLLSTYSPYLALEPHNRTALFAGMRETIDRQFGGSLQLSYICAFHLARKL
jgi:SAM-dependent methyltransferase